jgi:hypothetical protein
MYTVPGVDSLANDDRIASLYSGQGTNRQLIGVVTLAENVSVVLASEPPQLGGLKEIPVPTPLPRPVISSIAPSSGVPSGGTQVQVSGENFLDANAVFFGAVRAQTFTVDASGQSLTVISPAGQDSVHIAVVTPGGTSAMTQVDQFTYVEPTQIAVVAVQPNTGTSAGGDSIRVDVNANAAVVPQAILFGSVPASSVQYLGLSGVDIQRFSAVTPPNRGGDVHVTVVTQHSSSAPSPNNLFHYVEPTTAPLPAIIAIDPATGSVVGGDTVRIYGTDIGDAKEVKFGNVTSESFKVTMTDKGVVIDAISPCQVKGLAPVTVTTPRGTSQAVSASEFSYSLPQVLATVDFGSRAVNTTGDAKTATVPLKISLTDLPQGLVVPIASLVGDAFVRAQLQTLFQLGGLGPQFTVAQFVATFGNVTLNYAVSGIQLQRGRDFSVQLTPAAGGNQTIQISFVPRAQGDRADLLRASVGGISASGTGVAGTLAPVAGLVGNLFSGFINNYLAVLLHGIGILDTTSRASSTTRRPASGRRRT